MTLTSKLIQSFLVLMSLSLPTFNIAKSQESIEPSCIEQLEAQLPYTPMRESEAAWSPDGRHFALTYTMFNEEGTFAIGEGVAVFDGMSLEVVAEFARAAEALPNDPIVWSPTSERLAMRVGTQGKFEVIDVAGWQRRTISYSESAVVQQMMWSDDGQELAIVSARQSALVGFPIRAALATTVRIWNAETDVFETLYDDLQQARVKYAEGQWYTALREQSAESVLVYRSAQRTPLIEIQAAYLVDLAVAAGQILVATVEFAPQIPEDATLRVWDVGSAEITYQLNGDSFFIAYSTFTDNSSSFLAWTGWGSWLIHNFANETSIQLENQESVLISPDGRYAAAFESGDGGGAPELTITGDILITDVSSGEVVVRISRDGTSALLTWSPDSLSIITRYIPTALTSFSIAACVA
jgi:hypothetical protein